MASIAIPMASAAAGPSSAGGSGIGPDLLRGLGWRSIGPAMFGGRVTDVAGVPGDPNILYVGHSTAGLFKSENGGITFHSVFNDAGTLSVGAIAVSPGNPEVVYLGTGEGNPRNDTSFGDGIYKSTDGGRTWRHLGLEKTERFARIVVDPLHPQVVLAAAMGHEWGATDERGIFRSPDGGATWKRVLFVNGTTGASDVALDPQNPNIVYAGMYDYLRQPWHLRSGGPGSGLYRSTDGGETWVKLTDPGLHNGLPVHGPLGRIGISISRSNPNVVYAIIQSSEGLLWRSDDRGMHWRMVNDDRPIDTRPFYFSNIRVDPSDENRLFALSGNLLLSTDGGKSFHTVPGASIFGDHHAMWIDPKNPARILAGSDGGFFISNDGGAKWDFKNNMPMAQAYHVGVDMADPYHVMGGFQDHELWRGPNEKWNQVGVREGDWHRLRYMADGMNTIPDPRDPNIIYYNGHFGDITRIDLRNREERYIQPYPPGPQGGGANSDKYRFNWNAPMLMSPSDPDVVYFGGNVLFRTNDGGTTWKILSPDLTTNDPEKQKLSGGPIDPDNTRAEFYCTITTIAENPADRNVLWVGTDDGNVQVSRDAGAHWTNVAGNIQGVTPGGWITSVAASYKDPATAYVAIDRHQFDDFSSYVFVTHDFGKTWSKITDGLNGYAHIIAEDPKQPTLLYAGTELGIFASFDQGKTWTDLRLGLPRLPVYDLKVHPRDNDLIIATHARGFYILDDVTPLQQLAAANRQKLVLFQPYRATRYIPASDTSVLGNGVWVAPNKPYGAILTYFVPPSLAKGDPVHFTILDASGKVLHKFQGPSSPGLNRVVWDLREDVLCFTGASDCNGWQDRSLRGVRVLPGQYRARVEGFGQTAESSFEVRLDPRVKVSDQDLAAYDRESKHVVSLMYSIDEALAKIRNVHEQLEQLESRTTDSSIQAEAKEAQEQLKAVRVDLQPDPRDPEHLNLKQRLSWMLIQVPDYIGRPTPAQTEWISTLDREIQQVMGRLNGVLSGSVARLNTRLEQNRTPYISTAPQPASQERPEDEGLDLD